MAAVLLVVTFFIRCTALDHEDGYFLDVLDHAEAVSGQVHSTYNKVRDGLGFTHKPLTPMFHTTRRDNQTSI